MMAGGGTSSERPGCRPLNAESADHKRRVSINAQQQWKQEQEMSGFACNAGREQSRQHSRHEVLQDDCLTEGSPYEQAQPKRVPPACLAAQSVTLISSETF